MSSDSSQIVEALIVKHQKLAERIVRQETKGKNWLRDDCLSYTLEVLWEVAKEYVNQQQEGQITVDSFEAYATSSIKTRIRRHLGEQKKKHPWEWQVRGDTSNEEASAVDRLDDRSFNEMQHEEAAALLDEEERKVADARKEEKTYAEIAEELGWSVRYVTDKEKSGIEKVRRYYAEHIAANIPLPPL